MRNSPIPLKPTIIFIVGACLFSWPIFFIVNVWLVPDYDAAGNYAAVWLTALFGHLIAMLGPGIMSFILWKFYHKQPLPKWNWGKPRHYLIGAVAMILLWCLPAIIGLLSIDSYELWSPIEPFGWVFIVSSLTLVWLGALGEEFGWCGYLLQLLAPQIGKSRALVVSGAIRGFWHLPVLISPVIVKYQRGEKSLVELILLALLFLIQLVISNVFFGSLMGRIWYRTASMPLLGWIHQWFDATRDISVLLALGFGSSLWYKFGWGFPFYIVAYLALAKTAQEEGVSIFSLKNVTGG